MNSPIAAPISRRRFIAQTGLGLAITSTISRASAQGSVANSRIRLGLIGCGQRGQWILDLFAEHGGYEVVAVADYFQDKVDEAAAKHRLGPKRVFTGLQCAAKMIAAGGLDAVAIISPPYFHPAQARAAVAAGLHVYLAKPVAVDVPGCNSIQASAEQARRKLRVFLVDFQTRKNELFIEAIRRVHSGAMGEICFGEATNHVDGPPRKADPGTPEARLRNWLSDRALSGEIIVEQNIHVLDVMSWAMKETPPLRCTGTGGLKVRLDVGDCWDHFALVYEYANSVGVTFSSRQFKGHGSPGGFLNRMFGTKGALSTAYGGEVMIRGGAENFYRGGSTGALYKDGAIANIKSFHAHVMAGDVTNATVAPSVTSNLIAILGRTAARNGRTTTWNEIIQSKEKIEADLSALHS
jgi:myo-inositol 2-dehydrogenase/D-chiro-inositol 1-dehydrogenase